MTKSTDKLRSLFLAMLMVFSVMGGSIAFAGTAAAANAGNTGDVTSVTADDVDVSTSTTQGNITVSHPSNVSTNNISIALVQNDETTVINDTNNIVGTSPGTSETVFTVDYSESNGQNFETGDYTVYATTNGTASASNNQAETALSLTGASIDDASADDDPAVSPQGQEITYDLTLTNTGSNEITQAVELYSNSSQFSSVGAIPDEGTQRDSQTVTIGPGETQTVELTLDTGELNTGDYEIGVYTEGSPYSGYIAPLTVGTTSSGSVSITVRDANSDPVDVGVELYKGGIGGTLVQTTQSGSNGVATFTGLAVGSQGNPVNYTARAANQSNIFGSTTTTVQLEEPDSTSGSSTVTLQSTLEPQNATIASFNPQTEAVTGDLTTLLADGQVSNTGTYAVLSRTQASDAANQPVNSDVSVDLTTQDNDPAGVDIARFAADTDGDGDLESQGDSTTVTITPDSPTLTYQGATYSYEVVRVSAEDATEQNMTVGGTLSPTVLNDITATPDSADVADDTPDSSQVQYVLEGNESITGVVRDRAGEPISGATVWAAYEGSDQSQSNAENTFVNDNGEAFLIDTTGEDGAYAIPGLAGDNTNVTIYVDQQGYNRLNQTDTSVGQFVAAADEEQTAGPGATTENHDFVLTSVEVTAEYRLTLAAADGEGNFDSSSISMPIQSGRDVRVQLEVKAANEPESAYEPIENSTLADSKDVSFASSNIAVGSVADDPLTVSESGETTVFESTRTTGMTTLTATVTNGEGTAFTDSVNITTFGVGEITGQVINDEQPAQNLPGATVDLLRVENDGTETLVQTESTGPQGSYSFTEVRTGETYRVVAEFEGQTGFTEVNKTSAGTSNADVVVVGVSPEAADFQISGLSPTNVTVTQGDTITVSADVTNIGDDQATKDVDFRVDGNTLASESVELSGGENTTVNFENISTSSLDSGSYTHGVYTEDDSQTATLTVEGSNGGNGETSFQDVLVTIENYNNDDASFQDVLQTIENYNADN
ncbi:hypothetical protein GCM10027355_35690 [Haloplanus salinarum]|uniref:surface glycoprotein n=1 Tax=Haloplanus salinarum TaxID=1912324 RepID=UPI003B42A587